MVEAVGEVETYGTVESRGIRLHYVVEIVFQFTISRSGVKNILAARASRFTALLGSKISNEVNLFTG